VICAMRRDTRTPLPEKILCGARLPIEDAGVSRQANGNCGLEPDRRKIPLAHSIEELVVREMMRRCRWRLSTNRQSLADSLTTGWMHWSSAGQKCTR
jgi:hypothetical protein